MLCKVQTLKPFRLTFLSGLVVSSGSNPSRDGGIFLFLKITCAIGNKFQLGKNYIVTKLFQASTSP